MDTHIEAGVFHAIKREIYLRQPMITSYLRGHEIYHKNGLWYYSDNNELADDMRPCRRCGRLPTPEGYDACLGYIEGATHACCGHGVYERYIDYKR